MEDRAAKEDALLVTFVIIGFKVVCGGRKGNASGRSRGMENEILKFVSPWKQMTSEVSRRQIIA